MSQIIQLIRGKLVAWPTRGRGKRSFRDRGKLEAWRALIPTAWQIRGVANLVMRNVGKNVRNEGVAN